MSLMAQNASAFSSIQPQTATLKPLQLTLKSILFPLTGYLIQTQRLISAGLSWGPVMNSMSPLIPFFRPLDPSLIKSDEELKQFDAVEQVLMVGYPNGLWDSTNNFPLLRRGITASHPAVDFVVDGVATTVIDIASFPGSSGSPVFIYNDGSYPTKTGGIVLGTRVIFLGVLYSGPIFQPDGSIVVRNIPTVNMPVPVVNMMMNLGYMIKAKEVTALGATIF